jgi:hypothetical protein
MSSGLKVFVLGYTGETGKAVIKQLSRDNSFSNIILIGRRQVDLGDFQIADDSRFVSYKLAIYVCSYVNLGIGIYSFTF